MHERSPRRGGAILAALLLCASSAAAQDVTEPSLKAAFIYNFAKFTDWPQNAFAASAPFIACVLGDATVGAALERAVKGRELAGRTINVSHVGLDGNLRACHLIYVSGVIPAQIVEVITSVQGFPVLTISDEEDFDRLGGIAHMFVENGRMRFALNLYLARRSRLELSSKLLTLATRVYDGTNQVGR